MRVPVPAGLSDKKLARAVSLDAAWCEPLFSSPVVGFASYPINIGVCFVVLHQAQAMLVLCHESLETWLHRKGLLKDL